MTHIEDLQVKKEILPLFDFTGNDGSADMLATIFSDRPQSVEDILYRQQILKALLREEALFTPFSYSRSEFSEVFHYTQDIGSRMQGDPLTLQVRFLFAAKEKNREKGQLGQVFIFFHRIRQAWFSRLQPSLFPDEFGGRLKKINRMFVELDTGKNDAVARQGRFSIAEMIRWAGLLAEKCANGEMQSFWKDLFIFEAWLSIAKGIRRHNFVFPVFVPHGMTIRRLYHPMLKDPVKNNITISDTVTVITGPNMSGKSTLLRSVGLCVVLAHLGLAVPAEKCELPFFDVLSIAIDLRDDLRNGYSHFATEINHLKSVVVAARNGQRCFAMFDELFRGTNAEDALAISATTVTGLSELTGCHFFVSTHLYQLKSLIDWKSASIGTRFIECTLEGGLPSFTYQLKDGWSDLRIGQVIFEREGLNALLAGQVPAASPGAPSSLQAREGEKRL
jgi:DNA mismatch repair protein MutS